LRTKICHISLDANRLLAYKAAIFDLLPEIECLLAKGGFDWTWVVVCSYLDEKATLLWHFPGRNKLLLHTKYSGGWFQIFFIFHNIWEYPSH
jgi:hypothetical protein